MQITDSPNPTQVATLLKRLAEWTPIRSRAFDRIPEGKQSRKIDGNKEELIWALRGELLGHVERLPARQRDAVITCGIKGMSSEIVEQRWGVCRMTVWRDQRLAWRTIARAMGWRPYTEMSAD